MRFSHFDKQGNAAMVDVSEKATTARTAVATGRIHMHEACFAAVQQGTLQKGDVLGVARIAAIQATKNTALLIPLCHSIPLTNSAVEFRFLDEENAVEAVCTVCCEGKTGVEMEALTGVSVALLTIYDMCKALDKRMEIRDIHLVKKTGGKSGEFHFTQGQADHD